MQATTLVNKMREYVQDFRAQLLKKDMASVPALTRNTGCFFRELIAEMPEDVVNGLEVQEFLACVDRFGTACRQENLENAAQTLQEMEDVVARAETACRTVTQPETTCG